jgi:hypothetical protein
MMAGYAHVNQLLEEKTHLFEEKNVDRLLENRKDLQNS